MSYAPVPRARVIIDNDFSGDPDDFVQLVHHLLSPSVEVPFVIGSHLGAGDPGDPSDRQAENAVRMARTVIDMVSPSREVRVVQGSNVALSDPDLPIRSEAAKAIVAEAMRDDTDLPLYIALGGGLTELASALLIDPGIARRLIAVWIGGAEHLELQTAPPVGMSRLEYNTAIDLIAAQAIFRHPELELWQVPRDVYRQCTASLVELDERVRTTGPLGRFLVESIEDVMERLRPVGLNLGETYVLGDSPLVLLTALQTAFEPGTASSPYVIRPAPLLNDDGSYTPNPDGRPIRIYTGVDTRLMFEDFYLKLARHERSLEARHP